MGRTSAAVLHRDLATSLRMMIVDGELTPGSRIPERELCERFGVSRTPLREVLKVLAAEGHITLQPNRGAWVTSMSIKDVEDLFEVSGALESLSGELACARITDEEIDEIRQFHVEMAECHKRRDLPSYYTLNRRIHDAIVKAARNDTLQTHYDMINTRIRRARFVAIMPHDRWDIAMLEHEAIMNALIRRDGPMLGAILKKHLQHKSKQVVEAGFATET